MKLSDQSKGLMVTTCGVLVFVPDSLFIRLISTDTFTLAFWRSGISGLVIFAFLILSGNSGSITRLSKAGWLGGLYVFLMSASIILFVFAIRTTTVANALFLVSTAPIFAAILSRVFLLERISRRLCWAIGLSLVGIGTITFGSIEIGGTAIWGDFAALLVAFGIAVKHTIARRLKAMSMVPAVATAQLLLAAAVLVYADIQFLESQDLVLMLVYASLLLPVATSLMALGPRYITAPEVSLILLLEAVLAPILVWIALGEIPTSYSIVGGGLVVLVLATINFLQLRRPGPISTSG